MAIKWWQNNIDNVALGNSNVDKIYLGNDLVYERVTADTTPPTAPTNVTVSNPTDTTLTVSWNAATDNVAVASYNVYQLQGEVQVFLVNVTNLSVLITGLASATSYTFIVKAVDTSGNESGNSNQATGSTTAGDTQPPSTPTLQTVSANPLDIFISWSASTDNVGVTSYLLEKRVNDGTWQIVTTTAGTNYTDTGVLQFNRYDYRVKARDAAGNWSAYSNILGTIYTGSA